MSSHYVFAADVVLRLSQFQIQHQVKERLANLIELPGLSRIHLIQPGGCSGLDHQYLIHLLAHRHGGGQPCDVLRHHVIRIPPRLVVGERLRVVGLPCAAQRHIRQVFIKQVHTEHTEPVGDAFHILKAQVPAAGTVNLAQVAFASELITEALHFFYKPHVAELSMRIFAVLVHEAVNAGIVLPGAHGHIVGHALAVRPLVIPIVPREADAVRFTPVVIRLGPMFDVLFQDDLIVVVTHLLPVANGPNQTRQMIDQVVTPTLLKRLGQVIGPRQSIGRANVRFVGERPEDSLAELVADVFLIGIEGDFQEFLRDAGVHEIDITAIAVPGGVRRANHGRHHISPLRQRLAVPELLCDVLQFVGGQLIDGDH